MPAMRTSALCTCAIALLAACASREAPRRPSAPAPSPASSAVSTAAGTPVPPAEPDFVTVRDALIDWWLADAPSEARRLGLHEFDGKVADCSASGFERRSARLKRARE